MKKGLKIAFKVWLVTVLTLNTAAVTYIAWWMFVYTNLF